MLQHSTLRLFITFIFGGGLWVFIAYKAFTIPITHDEVATPLHYIKFSIWEIMMYPDPWPNNHILNTLLAKFSIGLFGSEDWAVRLPNVLSFGIYFYAAYQISNILFHKSNLLFAAALILFLGNPYLLDFFSLCRGYGMANAWMLMAALGVLRAFQTQQDRYIWWSFAFSLLAAYANFTFLIFWCALSGMLVIYYIQSYLLFSNKKQLVLSLCVLFAVNVAYITLIYLPIHKMQSTNQFVYWEANGFFQDTLVSLIGNSLYNSNILGLRTHYYAFLIAGLFFATGIYLLYRWWKAGPNRQKMVKQPLLLFFLLLAGTVAVNLIQTALLHTPNLTSRTALLYYPLFICLVNGIILELSNYQPTWAKWAGGIILFFSFWQLTRTLNGTSVREWWYDANTFEVLETLKNKEINNQKVTLQTAWQLYRSFQFYSQTGKTPWLDLKAESEQPQIDSLSSVQYYYIFNSDYAILQNHYEVIAKYDGGARLLLKKKE